ncbi:hypothetical protein [endosymbiont GvMRE of Glomus versiforme]|uniref:hypothetical protein n=1 Tax=endosymbiont GvMRE of Glomus versiforme TaxID=2039283 RepID=UPI000EDE1DA9|nr:hypothetical protein [endosymbiont GvMRE of Glomus versiforme]RHZ37357.1 hypothetical protein GvMRE_I1g610 [endosymbiont GvMRE of Glomus versiforme]
MSKDLKCDDCGTNLKEEGGIYYEVESKKLCISCHEKWIKNHEECSNCHKIVKNEETKIWSCNDEELFAPNEVGFDDRIVCEECYNKQKEKRSKEKTKRKQAHEKRCRIFIDPPKLDKKGEITRRCENDALSGKGYCSEHKKDFTCNQCQKEVWQQNINITIGDKYTRQERKERKLVLCLDCWEKDKNNWTEKVRQDEAKIQLNNYGDNGAGLWWVGIYQRGEICPTCDNWYFESKFNDTCSANCQKQYDNLSSHEQENLKNNKSLTNPTNTEREREREAKELSPMNFRRNSRIRINWISDLFPN